MQRLFRLSHNQIITFFCLHTLEYFHLFRLWGVVCTGVKHIMKINFSTFGCVFIWFDRFRLVWAFGEGVGGGGGVKGKMTPMKIAPRIIAPWMINPRKIAPRKIAPEDNCPPPPPPRKLSPHYKIPPKIITHTTSELRKSMHCPRVL